MNIKLLSLIASTVVVVCAADQVPLDPELVALRQQAEAAQEYANQAQDAARAAYFQFMHELNTRFAEQHVSTLPVEDVDAERKKKQDRKEAKKQRRAAERQAKLVQQQQVESPQQIVNSAKVVQKAVKKEEKRPAFFVGEATGQQLVAVEPVEHVKACHQEQPVQETQVVQPAAQQEDRGIDVVQEIMHALWSQVEKQVQQKIADQKAQEAAALVSAKKEKERLKKKEYRKTAKIKQQVAAEKEKAATLLNGYIKDMFDAFYVSQLIDESEQQQWAGQMQREMLPFLNSCEQFLWKQRSGCAADELTVVGKQACEARQIVRDVTAQFAKKVQKIREERREVLGFLPMNEQKLNEQFTILADKPTEDRLASLADGNVTLDDFINAIWSDAVVVKQYAPPAKPAAAIALQCVEDVERLIGFTGLYCSEFLQVKELLSSQVKKLAILVNLSQAAASVATAQRVEASYKELLRILNVVLTMGSNFRIGYRMNFDKRVAHNTAEQREFLRQRVFNGIIDDDIVEAQATLSNPAEAVQYIERWIPGLSAALAASPVAGSADQ